MPTEKKKSVRVRDLKSSKNAKGGGKVQVHDIQIVKTTDKSTPTLML
jgi:type VI protein secretion system component Hcp